MEVPKWIISLAGMSTGKAMNVIWMRNRPAYYVPMIVRMSIDDLYHTDEIVLRGKHGLSR